MNSRWWNLYYEVQGVVVTAADPLQRTGATADGIAGEGT
jgi:hypothetical protein